MLAEREQSANQSMAGCVHLERYGYVERVPDQGRRRQSSYAHGARRTSCTRSPGVVAEPKSSGTAAWHAQDAPAPRG